MTAHNFFALKKVKFNRRLQKPTKTDQDEISSIKVSYNKGIHTIVLTWLGILAIGMYSLDMEGNVIMLGMAD